MSADVFISYKREDEVRVAHLVLALEKGVRPRAGRAAQGRQGYLSLERKANRCCQLKQLLKIWAIFRFSTGKTPK